MIELENNQSIKNVHIFKNSLSYLTENLLIKVEGYANCNETYQQVDIKDDDWFAEYFTYPSSNNLNNEFIVLTDKSGEIVISKGDIPRYTGNMANVPEISRCLQGKKIRGLMRIDNELYIVAGSPVLKNNGLGSPNGALFVGQRIDNTWLKSFNQYLGQETGYWWQNEILFPEDNKIINTIKTANFSPEKINDNFYIYRTSSFMLTFFPVYDIWGDVAAYFILSEDSTFFHSKLTHMQQFLMQTFLISLILITIFSYILTNTTLRPIKKLQSLINNVKEIKKPVQFNLTGFSEIVELSKSVNEMAISLEEHTRLQKENEMLTLLAITDGLTNLYNHKYFHDKLKELINAGEKIISVIMLDVDNLFYYNEILGYPAGDDILKNVAILITRHTPKGSIIARYGDDEFGVILPGYSINEATIITQDIQKAVEINDFPFYHKMPGKKITIAAGIAAYPSPASSKDELIKLANQELYNTKNFSQKKIGQYVSILSNLQKDINGYEEELIRFAKLILVMVNAKDKYTYFHTQQVLKFSGALGKALNLSPQELNQLTLGALLHDIGKLELDKQILNKAEPLTDAEWQMIQQHPVWGAQMLSPLNELNKVDLLVRHHHERYDGKGYPDNLSGNDIPLGARIIAVADSFDAMTTHRPYRKAKTIPEALLELEKHSGTQFDPEIVKAFREIINEII